MYREEGHVKGEAEAQGSYRKARYAGVTGSERRHRRLGTFRGSVALPTR